MQSYRFELDAKIIYLYLITNVLFKKYFLYYLIQETCNFWIVGIPEYSSYDTEKGFSGKAKLETANCLISLLVN